MAPTNLALREAAETSLLARLRYYLTPVDGRFEDLVPDPVRGVARDLAAGLVVAMVAIPLAMGFAMASGLRPEQGIIGGAIAALVGALFGGSKYQVYGPTAAFIPVIAAAVALHGYPFVVLASLISGVILMAMGLGRLGRYVARVPHPIVVGFTLGIAVVIALSYIGDMLGIHAKMGHELMDKLHVVSQHLAEVSIYPIVIGLGTFVVTKAILKVSPFVPGPAIAMGLATIVSATVWADKHMLTIKDKYGAIPDNLLTFSAPAPMVWTLPFVGDLLMLVIAIVFVSGIESLLCSRMADRLAGNDRTPFHPDKELWGQGWVQVIVPLVNGFPHTGALARTAANIRLGAVSPLSGVFKAVLKVSMAIALARYLEMVPLACIGGIMLYVASGMVKWDEVKEVVRGGRWDVALMGYTAIAVIVTNFLTGVMSAMIIAAIAYKLFPKHTALTPMNEADDAIALGHTQPSPPVSSEK